MNDKKANWALLARYLSGECGKTERQEIEAWLKRDSGNRDLLASMQRVWDQPEPPSEPSDVERLWRQLARRGGIAIDDAKAGRDRAAIHRLPPGREKAHVPLWRTPIWRMAAILLVAAGMLYYFAGDSSFMPWRQQLNTISVDFASRENVPLSDGSTVALDAGTNMRFPDSFTDGRREVFLQGEGYFDVASDDANPFIVHASHATVQVRGTKFNVRAWPEEKRVVVTVYEGSVSLSRGEGGNRTGVILAAGQQSILSENGEPSQPIAVTLESQPGWMQNRIRFENASLREILAQLQRWYDVRFEMPGGPGTAERLTIDIDNQPIGSIMDLISALTDLDYQQQGRVITLTRKEEQ